MDDSSSRVASPNSILVKGMELTDSSSKSFTTAYRMPTKRGEKNTMINCVLSKALLYFSTVTQLPRSCHDGFGRSEELAFPLTID